MTATAALEGLVELLTGAGIAATRDAGAFRPQPIGVLVGLPARVGATLGAVTFEIPVLVVSGDPLNTVGAVDRLYAEADELARLLSTDSYRPASWASSQRAEPLPALELTATVTVQNEEA